MRGRRRYFAVIALGPFLLFGLIFGAYPLLQVARMSTADVSLGSSGFEFTWGGLNNYVSVLSNPQTWEAIGQTGAFLLGVVPGSVIVGTVLALLVNRAVIMLPLARNILIWPAVVTPVVVSTMWLLILNPTAGGLNKLLASLELPGQAWLNSGGGAMASVVFVDIWHWTPVVFLFVYTALQALSSEVLEAARIDGASEVQVLRYVVLPMLLPAIAAVSVVRIIQGVKAFDEMYILTRGGPDRATTLVSQQVQIWFHDLRFGDAAAFSIVVVLLTSACLAIVMHIRSILVRRAG